MPEVQLRTTQVQNDLVLSRTISYLPRGMAYALFAPFPWAIQRTLDLTLIPETLLWYVVLAAAVATLIRRRAEWRLLAGPVGIIIGIVLILSLAEGNVGTLYRHRAMSQPWVFMLASPTLLGVLTRTLHPVDHSPELVPAASGGN